MKQLSSNQELKDELRLKQTNGELFYMTDDIGVDYGTNIQKRWPWFKIYDYDHFPKMNSEYVYKVAVPYETKIAKCNGYYLIDNIFVHTKLSFDDLFAIHGSDHILTINPLTLQYIPDDLITYGLCIHAVSLDIKALKYVPEKYLDEGFHLCVLGRNPRYYDYLPNALKTMLSSFV